jgi:hypothetical protein
MQLLHPRKILGEMSFERTGVDDDEPLNDWMSHTSTIPVLVQWQITMQGQHPVSLNIAGASRTLQMIVGQSIGESKPELTRVMQMEGRSEKFFVEGDELEEIDFTKTDEVRCLASSRKIEVFVKQTKFEVDETETWMHASKRLAQSFGMPEWSVFRFYPVEGGITKLGGSSSDDDEAYTVDWITRRPYWWQNEYDESCHMPTGEGRQIHLSGPLFMEDTMAICRGWTVEEIWEPFTKTLNH